MKLTKQKVTNSLVALYYINSRYVLFNFYLSGLLGRTNQVINNKNHQKIPLVVFIFIKI